MRYIPIENLTSGMVLGKDLFDGAGRVLLSKHVILSHEYISNLSYLGFQGAYIDEKFTRGVEIQEVLQPEVKREALKLVTDMFNMDTLEKDEFTEEQKVLSPGVKYKHYAPNTKSVLIYSKNNEKKHFY